MKPQMTPLAAQRFLHRRFGSAIGKVHELGRGEWSTAFSYEDDGHAYVVRFGALDEDFTKDRLVSRLVGDTLPVPGILEIGQMPHGYYALSERKYGQFLDELDADSMSVALPDLFAVIDTMKAVDISSTRGFGVWDATGDAPFTTWRDALLDTCRDKPTKRIHGWRKRMEASPVGVQLFDEASHSFEALVSACPNERHLIHSDLLYHNVLVQDSKVSAVIDWGSSMYGDFLYDLAWLMYWWPWYPAWSGIDIQGEIARHYGVLGIPYFEARLLAYQVHIGLDAQIYNAFTSRWDHLERNGKQTIALVHG